MHIGMRGAHIDVHSLSLTHTCITANRQQIKEQQTQDGVSVRWDVGLNKKRVAIFKFGRNDEYEAHLVRARPACVHP